MRAAFRLRKEFGKGAIEGHNVLGGVCEGENSRYINGISYGAWRDVSRYLKRCLKRC